jgi:hypothetical protein
VKEKDINWLKVEGIELGGQIAAWLSTRLREPQMPEKQRRLRRERLERLKDHTFVQDPGLYPSTMGSLRTVPEELSSNMAQPATGLDGHYW